MGKTSKNHPLRIAREAEIRKNFPKAMQLIFKRGEEMKLNAENTRKLIQVLGIQSNATNYAYVKLIIM
jgi:hypothetical protein